MDPPDIPEAVIYIQWPCPTRSGLAVGCFYVEIEGLSSRELFKISVFFFPRSGGARVSSSNFFGNSLETKLCNIVFPLASV